MKCIPLEIVSPSRSDSCRQQERCFLGGQILPAAILLLAFFGSARLATAQQFFFGAAAEAEEDDGEKNSDWSIDELLQEADEVLDQQWDDQFKLHRAKALLRFDELERMCKLSEPQRRKLVAACKGMAYKQTWKWRQQIQNQIAQTLGHYQRRGVSRAQAKALVASYTSGNIRFGSSADGGDSPEAFWKRTVESVLTPEQRQIVSSRQRFRDERERRLQIDRMLAALDRGLRLTEEQEKQFRKLIVTYGVMETPGVMFGGDDPFEEYWSPSWAFAQLFRRPEARKILSKAQWEVVKQSMEERGGWGGEIVVEEEEEVDEQEEGEAAEATADPDKADPREDEKPEESEEADGEDDAGENGP